MVLQYYCTVNLKLLRCADEPSNLAGQSIFIDNEGTTNDAMVNQKAMTRLGNQQVTMDEDQQKHHEQLEFLENGQLQGSLGTGVPSTLNVFVNH